MSDGTTTEKVIVGFLTGMEPRNSGWFRFAIQEEGKQYPVRLDTKKPEIVEQCKALMGQLVKAAYGEQVSSNINPNNNQPYTNRYLNTIAAAGAGDVSSAPTQQQTSSGQQQPAQQQQRAPGAMSDAQKKELRIMREVGAKLAVDMASAGILPVEQQTVQGLIAASETWVAYFAYGPVRFGLPAFNQIHSGAQAAPAEQQAEQQQLPTEEPTPEPEPVYEFTCDVCGTHDAGNHNKVDGQDCPNDIPF